MNLEVLLEVEVGDLGLVINAEKLGKSGVGDDAALEVGVEAVVGLHVLRDVLGDLSLRALGAGRDAHKGAELGGERALNEEGVVRTAGLPGLALLGGHLIGGDLALLLGIALLLLGDLGGLLGSLHGLAHLGGELGGESLELLSEGSKESLRGLGGSGRSNNGGGDGGNNDLSLRGSLLLSLGGSGGLLGGCSGRGRGGRRSRLGGGLLVGGHLRV